MIVNMKRKKRLEKIDKQYIKKVIMDKFIDMM